MKKRKIKLPKHRPHESVMTQNLIIKPLKKALGDRLYITKVPGTVFKRGQPDVRMILAGRAIEAEVKMWDNPLLTSLQSKTLADMNVAGAITMRITIKEDRSLVWERLFYTGFGEEELKVLAPIFAALNVTPPPMRGMMAVSAGSVG